MRNILTDFYLANRGGGHGGVLTLTQGDERCIAILIERGLTQDELFLTLQDATDLIDALKREIQKGD